MRKAKIKRPRRKKVYHVCNWSQHDQAPFNRGSITIWVWDGALGNWRYKGPSQRGAKFDSSDQAIESMMVLGEVFHSVEGFVASLFGF